LALKTLAAEEGRFPEYVALALGISRDPSARMPLRLVLSNGHAGAALVGEVDAVPSRVAAYAALALGQVGDAEDARWLAQCVGDAKRPSDVRSMALLGLAALVERGDPRDGVVAALVPLLHDASLLESVRALIPQVLVKSGDPVAIDAVVRFLAEFKKPLAVRRAAALALGELEVIDGVGRAPLAVVVGARPGRGDARVRGARARSARCRRGSTRRGPSRRSAARARARAVPP
jgi:HEAT repeat protein